MNGRNGRAALLVLRLVIGWLFLWHGLGKFFGPPFAGVGMPAFSAILSLHLGGLSDGQLIAIASATALLETAGGLLLLVGWMTTPAASVLLLAQIANVAVLKFDEGLFGPLGWEDQLVVMTALFALILGGAGAFSLDASDEAAPRRARTTGPAGLPG